VEQALEDAHRTPSDDLLVLVGDVEERDVGVQLGGERVDAVPAVERPSCPAGCCR
jgi:hypothetical protein